MTCPRCETGNHPVTECPERHEEYHGLPSDHDADQWVLEDRWHASVDFDADVHTAACGETVTTPVNWVSEDLRYVDSDAPVCEDCVDALEATDDDRLETVPDGGDFEPATKLRADGGEVDVYQWVLENVHEYPAGTDSRWGSRGNLVYEGRKLDGVSKDDVQEAIARAADNEDLLSWHGLLARAEIDRLREITRVEHEEHEITRGILVGKCNKLIAKKKQEQADEAEPEIVTDGGYPEPEILDVVDAPGGECQMWSGEGPSPCENDADYLVVYAASTRPDDDRRKNALACSDCFTPRGDEAVATDGGTPRLPYADLEFEAAQLLEHAADRLDEGADRHGDQAYQGYEPAQFLWEASLNIADVDEAIRDGDREEAYRQAGDVLNYLLMALSNVDRNGGGSP